MTTELSPFSRNLPSADGFAPASPLSAPSGGIRTNPIFRYLSAVRRFKWLVLLLSVIGTGGGYVMSKLKPEMYNVNAVVLVGDEGSTGPYQALGNAGRSLIELLTSYPVTQFVAEKRHLYIFGPKRLSGPPLPPGPSGPDAALFKDFTWTPKSVPGEYSLKLSADGRTWEMTETKSGGKDRGAIGDSIGRKFGFAWLPRVEPRWFGQTFGFTVVTPREAAENLAGRIGAGIAPGSKFMHINLTGQNAQETADQLNEVLTQFVYMEDSTKKRTLNAQLKYLDSQRIAARDKLNMAETALANFSIKTITLARDNLPVAPGLNDAGASGYSGYTMTREKLTALTQDRDDLKSRMAHLMTSDSLNVDEFLAIPTVRNTQAFRATLDEYASQEKEYRAALLISQENCTSCIPSPPAIRERMKFMRKTTIPTYANAVIRQLEAQINRTDNQVTGIAGELKGIPDRIKTETDLRRDVAIQNDVVTNLEKSYAAAQLQQATASNDVSIFAAAVPPARPTKNRKQMLIALGAILGIGAGLGLALLLDLTDKRVRYADQITGGLGLSILGVVPEIRRAKGETPLPEEAAQVIEAFRTIRLNLAHTVGEGPINFTISSPSPGDGKSLVASNLSLSFAEAGYRTLLIDGDTRRGELHRTFGLERRPGLLDHLVGEIGMDDMIRTTSHPQLRVITGGSRKRNAPELLGSSRMRELIVAMRDRFDVIIVDSPPLGAGIDPFVLSTITGNMLLVMRAGATERDLAEAKLQIVDQLPIRLIGAVLNDVRASMNDYKYYSYSYGYGAVDEGPDVPKIGPGSGTEE